LTLQSMEVLVYILRAQSRLTEAVDTSTSLCKRIEAALGSDHPQTLRSKSQLAAAALSCGDYSTSAEILEKITATSIEAFGERHPDTLRYRSELAQAYCYSWKISLAGDLVLDVLSKQRSIYTIREPEDTSEKQQEMEPSREPLLPGLLDDVKEDISTLRVHPDLLFSMQLLAKIESKKPVPNLDLVQDIQQIIWDRRKSMLKQTRETALSLTSEFELAITFREKGDLEKALAKFERVSRERSRLLGTQHPETLAARHEALVTKYTLGEKVDVGDLERILNLREWQLGRSHPDTCQSLLWIFAILLLQEKDAQAIATADKLLERLSQPAIRRQRLVESLKVAEKVAIFYKGQAHYGKSAKIFSDILKITENSKATSDIAFNLEALRVSASENL
jgi:tetratricopeptide (TPR) repeat protein